MERQLVIDQYWQAEKELKALARERRMSLRRFLTELPSQQEDTITRAKPLLQRQVELLHQMRQWELEGLNNVVALLPVSRGDRL